MRLGIKYDALIERIGVAFNLIPTPLGFPMFGPPVARALQIAQRTGMLRELAAGPATATELAERLELRPQGVKLVLDTLCAADQLRLRRGERYEMPASARKWLDPESPSYIGGFLADSWHYWDWWRELEPLVREGRSIELHDKPPDDPYWRSTGARSRTGR